VSLVDAEGAVYKTALEHNENEAFILVSESHVPVLTPDCMYTRVFNLLDVTASNADTSDPMKLVMIGIVQQQNDISSHLTDFVDGAEFLSAIATDTYNIPMSTSRSKITPILQWKILSRRGATEFVHMDRDDLFMSLFDTRNHFSDASELKHETTKNIIFPASAPDEGTFVMWLNYQQTIQTNEVFCLVVHEFTVMDYDMKAKRILSFTSVGVCGPTRHMPCKREEHDIPRAEICNG
jgi:hypothetical protein